MVLLAPLPGALAGGIAPDAPAALPLVPLPVLPVLPVPVPAEPLVEPVLLEPEGGVDGRVLLELPLLPELLPVLPGERVLPVSVGSDLPQAPKASKELKAMAKAG